MTMRPSGRSAARGVVAIWRAGVQFVGHLTIQDLGRREDAAALAGRCW